MDLISKFKTLPENRKLLLWTIALIIITVILTATAPDTVPSTNENILMESTFWLINSPFIIVAIIFLAITWRTVIKKKEHYLQAIGITLAAVLMVMFMMDMCYHNIFSVLKQFIINLFDQ